MTNDIQSKKVTGHTSAIQVEGYGVPQPIDEALHQLKTLSATRKVIKAKIANTDPEDEAALHSHTNDLTYNENRIIQWGVPLHAFAPHKFPPHTSYL